MTVTPAQRGGTSNVGGGLAALVNLALPSGDSGSDFNLYLDLLKSRNVADQLAKDPELMHTLYAYNWDSATQTWQEHPDTGRYHVAMKSVRDYLGYPSVPWHAPDGETLLGFISYNLNIEQDPRRPYLAKVIFNYGDREFAKKFLMQLHQSADEMLRQRTIKRTNDYISYLSSTLAKTTVAEHRLALAQSLSEQEKAAMAAKSGAPYATEVLEAPWAGSDPSYPQGLQTLARWTAIGILGGTVLSLMLWRMQVSWDARRARRRRKLALISDQAEAKAA